MANNIKVVVKNITGGPKVLNSIPPGVLAAGDSTDVPVEMTSAEYESAKATGYYEFSDIEVIEADDAATGDALETARREVAEAAQAHIDSLKSDHADALAAVNERADKAEADLAEANEKIASLEADLAEATKPAELPGLTGKNKAELLAIAKSEGADVAEDATNAQIVDAIEAKRAG